jgi:hypothetical protein
MDLFTLLAPVMAKHEAQYRELYAKFKAALEANENLKPSAKVEADSKTRTDYFEQAKELLKNFNAEALQTAAVEENRLQTLENEKNSRIPTMEQRILDSNLKVLTMQILSTDNLALIRQHFEDNREYLPVLAMMRDYLTRKQTAPNSDKIYFAGNPEEAAVNSPATISPEYSGLLTEIGQAMVTDLDRIGTIKQQVTLWAHYPDELHTALIPHYLHREFYGDQSGAYFSTSAGASGF